MSEFPERIIAGPGEEYLKLQLHLDHWQLLEWLEGLSPWDVIAHLTFRWEVSLDAARRGYERFMRRSLPHCDYFYAEEQNPCRDGYHIHALWHDAVGIYRKEKWADWFMRFGRARIEPIRSKEQTSNYCAKYVAKERAWWNVHVQRDVAGELRKNFAVDHTSEDRRLPVPQREFGFAADVFNLACDQALVLHPLSPAPGASQSEDPGQLRWTPGADGVWRPAL